MKNEQLDDAAKAVKKRSLKQTNHWELNNFTYLNAEINNGAFNI